MTTTSYTATVRRYNGTSGEREIERKIRIPLPVYLESFAELWPFHREMIQDDNTIRVMVYSTQGRFQAWNADYFFTIEPITA